MMEGERGVIIAMQGDPCTGKTAIANILGRRLKCTTIRFDDILDFVAPGLESPQPPKKLDALLTQAFDLLTQIAKTQTCLGMSVVVDSPLSRRSHLDRLVELVTEPCGKDQEAAAVRLIIVQCKPETRYMWETELSSQLGSRYKNKWYKPQSCPIENEFTRDYDDKHIPARLVSKLVVKTSSYVPPPDPLAAAVDYLIRAREAQEVDFQTWLRDHDISRPRYKEARKLGCLYNDESSNHQKRPLKRIKVLTEFCRDGHLLRSTMNKGCTGFIPGHVRFATRRSSPIRVPSTPATNVRWPSTHRAQSYRGKGVTRASLLKNSPNFSTGSCTNQPIASPSNTCASSAQKKRRSSRTTAGPASSKPISSAGCCPPSCVTRRMPSTGFTSGSAQYRQPPATNVPLAESLPTPSASLVWTGASFITPSVHSYLEFSKSMSMVATSTISAWYFTGRKSWRTIFAISALKP